jgi:hypothetical protein
MREPLETSPHKTTGSAQGEARQGLPFGQPAAHVPPIDELAKIDGYQRELAYLMAIVSAWSYSDETVLSAKLRYYGMPSAYIRRVTVQNNALLVATTAYLIQSPSGKTAVLAFRGTDPGNIITILTDTQVMLQPFFDAHVHSGFHASVEVIWDDVDTALRKARAGIHLDDDDQDVPLPNKLEALYVTGHSLGGAMAVLAAARLSRPDYAKLLPPDVLRGVYTYGQPMVGNEKFAAFCQERFGDRLFRHVFHNDVVPQVPPRSNLAYAHAGREYRSGGLNEPWVQSSRISERAPLALALAFVAANAVEARISPRDVLPGPSIDDHMPPSYVEVSRYSLNPSTAVLERKTRLGRAWSAISERFESASGVLSNRIASPQRAAQPETT